MVVSVLQSKANALVRSSKFTHGDKLSFNINVGGDVLLPGNHDSKNYVDGLGLGDLKGLKVVVVCARNGGIVAEAIARGAAEVYAYEPNYLFKGALKEVVSLIQKKVSQKIMLADRWPDILDQGNIDVIIWPEGVDEARNPRAILRTLLSLLSPTGVCYIEAVIGGHGIPGKVVNSWKPSEEAIIETIKEVQEGVTVDKVGQGRLENRIIFRLVEDSVVIIDKERGDGALTQSKIQRKKPKTTRNTAKTKRKQKRKTPKKTPAKVAKVMKIMGMSRESVEQEVGLWGDQWLDKIIKSDKATSAPKKDARQSRGTTSDNIGVDPLPA